MKLVVHKDVAMSARDGTRLIADVYLPGEHGVWPTLLARMPYDKAAAVGVLGANGFDLMRAVAAGYAVVAQDTRGRAASEGEFRPFAHEADDGADTIEWAASQSWSTGAIGMVGGSYLGVTQWTAAATAPPALKAIAPALTSAQYHEGWTYQGGAFQLGFNLWWSTWILGTGELRRRMVNGDRGAGERLGRLVANADRPDELYARRPLQDLSELADVAPYYGEWLAHPEYDAFWRSTAPPVDYQRITAPALHLGGWFDAFLPGTLESFVGMRRSGGNEEARRRQRLVVGPWAHGNPSGSFPEGGFGLTSGINGAIDSTGLQLQWFDWLLKGEETALDLERPVRLFVMGPNVWRDEADWPLPDTDYETWYLHSDGRANGASGDGRLTRSAPGPDEPGDVYLYDPRRPVPTLGGATYLPGLFVSENAGPRDQRALDARTDILSYTSDPLEEPLDVIGPLRVVLHASSSASDTDFTAKLVVIAPDGRAIGVADGILRARYRDAAAGPSPLRPDEIYSLTVELGATAIVVAAGYRLRVQVASSNFPRFDPNTNTGGDMAAERDTDLRVALNRIHHTAAHPSHLVLPVIRR